MNEYQIHDAIGEISEELIAPIAKLRQKKRYPAVKWVAAAACLCLLLSLPLELGTRQDMNAESAGSLMEPETEQENKHSGLMDQEDGKSDMVADVAAFRAKVLEVHEKCVLVEPLDGENERNCSDKIYVSFRNIKQIPEIKAGDVLEIRYDGLIQETYPAQIYGTYGIEVIE